MNEIKWYMKRTLNTDVLDAIGVCPVLYNTVADKVHAADLVGVLEVLGSYDIDVMFEACGVNAEPSGEIAWI